jgi:hypothetical protein
MSSNLIRFNPILAAPLETVVTRGETERRSAGISSIVNANGRRRAGVAPMGLMTFFTCQPAFGVLLRQLLQGSRTYGDRQMMAAAT